MSEHEDTWTVGGAFSDGAPDRYTPAKPERSTNPRMLGLLAELLGEAQRPMKATIPAEWRQEFDREQKHRRARHDHYVPADDDDRDIETGIEEVYRRIGEVREARSSGGYNKPRQVEGCAAPECLAPASKRFRGETPLCTKHYERMRRKGTTD